MVKKTIRAPNANDAARIWGDGFRLFLSHKSEVKVETGNLKNQLKIFGISGFVAHADIHPTLEWQSEIENALASMDGFAALMTDRFHQSNWTDQEIGYAISRGVPIVPVSMGTMPYGFISKFQALSCEWSDAPEKIAGALIHYDAMFDAYIKMLRACRTSHVGNELAELLPFIKSLPDKRAQALISAYNGNSELQGSFGFNGVKPADYGPGLISYLTKLTRYRFDRTADGQI